MAAENMPAPDSLIELEESKKYWEGIDATVSGMLGGKTTVSRVDLQGSKTLLARLGYGIKTGRKRVARVLEGGAGIGRITEGLLLPIADSVDIIEPVSKFTNVLQGKPGVENVYNVGLEGWRPEEGVLYDLIWVQWCAMYLSDQLLVEFLERAKGALHPDGFIVLKENISSGNKDAFDEEDSSVTRGDDTHLAIFKKAGLTVVRKDLQRGMPLVDGVPLLPVMMYAMK